VHATSPAGIRIRRRVEAGHEFAQIVEQMADGLVHAGFDGRIGRLADFIGEIHERLADVFDRGPPGFRHRTSLPGGFYRQPLAKSEPRDHDRDPRW